MILRRVIEHVKAQNWIAVGLDFLIVVSGIFVGLQVDRWNEARVVDADERVFLARVQDDIRQDAVEMRERSAYLEGVSQAGARVIAFLDEDRACSGDCWKILTDYFQASQWQDLTPNRATFDEIRRTGFPRDAALRNKITGYYTLFDQVVVVAGPPRYREIVRSQIPTDAQEHFWRACHVIRPREQKIVSDCDPIMTEAQAGAVVEKLRMHPDLRPSLTFWKSTLVGVIEVVAVQIAETESIVLAIDGELDGKIVDTNEETDPETVETPL